MEDGLVVEVLLWHDGLDDMLHEVSVDLVVGDVGGVLGGDEDGVHADGRQGAALLLVLHRHLRLAVRPQPADCAILAHLQTRNAMSRGQDIANQETIGWCTDSIPCQGRVHCK